MAGKITIAEVEEIVEPGELDPDQIHTPGVFVQRLLLGTGYQKKLSVGPLSRLNFLKKGDYQYDR
jgi:acyl CoA:acetate/3-ketoacid CoA transferase